MLRYEQVESSAKLLDLATHVRHDPAAWLKFYISQTPAIKRAMRLLVQMQTLQALINASYYLPEVEAEAQPPPRKVRMKPNSLTQPAFDSVKYDSDHKFASLDLPSPNLPTTVYVVAGDCLEVALRPPFQQTTKPKKEPLVLDMASMSLPGGGWKSGSAAQEENLHRRTNIVHCLEDPYRVNELRAWDYPIPQYGGLYLPGITVFRGAEASGYPFLEHPQTVSIVAAAALKQPPTEERLGEEVLDKKLARDTLRKIEAILAIAVENGHDFLVLGAFGCGAYANPPAHISRLFKEALSGPRFAGRFAHVVFAIIDSETKLYSNTQQASTSTSAPSEVHIPAKAKIFAKTFAVDVLNLDGSILWNCTDQEGLNQPKTPN